MDLLASLGLESALPEQSTRLSSHPGIVAALQRADDGGVRLGFDACLRCGASLGTSDDGGDDCEGTTTNNSSSSEGGKRAVTCAGCRRVRYCSPACRAADAEPGPAGAEEEEDAAGHSPVICALLALCDGDETAEAEMCDELNPTNRTHPNGANDGSNGGGKTKGTKGKKRPRTQPEEASRYRVRTEWESYPATLCNVLSEGPDWFVESMTRRLRTGEEVRSPVRSSEPSKKRRRGKRDRASMSPTKDDAMDGSGGSGGRRRELVLHVVGASSDAELWGWDGTANDNDDDEEVHEVLRAYAEAATNLHSYLRSLLEASAINVRCVFVGPDCPAGNPSGNQSRTPCRATVPLPDTRSATLTIETHQCYYGETELPAPDAIVFFNPGLSCPDYDWSNALSTAVASASAGSIPFLITTNTEMEALADTKCLVDAGCVDPSSLPKDILEAIDGENAAEGTNDSTNDFNNNDAQAFFLGENPYAGLRVRQSGTMGNDLYVKSRWLVGGLFCAQRSKKKKREATPTEGPKRARKRRRSEGPGGGGSAKRRNPALI